MKEWFLAVNPWSLPASAMPALVAISFVFFCKLRACNGSPVNGVGEIYEVNWLFGVLAFFGAVIAQMSGNLFNDYFDYKWGVDVSESYGVNRSLIDHIFEPNTILAYGFSMAAVVCILGFAMAFSLPSVQMWILIAIGFVGILLSFSYTYLKYKTLGDVVIFVEYGLLISLGVFFVMTGKLNATVLLVSVPTGLWVVNILNANNIRDRFVDGKNNPKVKTAPIAFGAKPCIIYYMVCGIAAYVILVADAVFGIVSWMVPVLSLVSIPLAIKNFKKISKGYDPGMISKLDAETAQFVVFFSLLVVVGNFAGAMI